MQIDSLRLRSYRTRCTSQISNLRHLHPVCKRKHDAEGQASQRRPLHNKSKLHGLSTLIRELSKTNESCHDVIQDLAIAFTHDNKIRFVATLVQIFWDQHSSHASLPDSVSPCLATPAKLCVRLTCGALFLFDPWRCPYLRMRWCFVGCPLLRDLRFRSHQDNLLERLPLVNNFLVAIAAIDFPGIMRWNAWSLALLRSS